MENTTQEISYYEEKEINRKKKFKIGNTIKGRIMKEDRTIGQVHAFNQLKSNAEDRDMYDIINQFQNLLASINGWRAFCQTSYENLNGKERTEFLAKNISSLNREKLELLKMISDIDLSFYNHSWERKTNG